VCVLARCGVQSSGIFVALWPSCVVLSRHVVVRSRNTNLVAPPRVYVCIGMDSVGHVCSSLAQDLYGSGRNEVVRPPPRHLGVRGASIVRCGLSCLVDLNSDLYRLCGSLHGLDTFWARGLS